MTVRFFVRTLDVARGGGSHYNAICYIRALRKREHAVLVHVFDERGNTFPDDITPILHNASTLSFAARNRLLAELLRQYEAGTDVFFLYGVDFIWGGGRYRRAGGRVPVVVYLDAYLASMGRVHEPTFAHTRYRLKRFLWDQLIGRSLALSVDRFLPCSPYIGESYQRFLRLPKQRFTLLSNIIRAASPALREASEGKRTRLLYVGRLVRDKGIDLLLEALRAIPPAGWMLTVVGDGELRGFVDRAVTQYHLPVTAVGWVPQERVKDFYRDADFFVHPARWPDPAPRAIVDALAAGLPVVVPDTGGSAWITGAAGLVFTTGDVATLRTALVRLIEDKRLRKMLAARGPARAADFSEERVVPLLERILREVSSVR